MNGIVFAKGTLVKVLFKKKLNAAALYSPLLWRGVGGEASQMKRIITLIFLFIGFAAHSSDAQKSLRTVTNQAFKPGEVLKFRLHYGIISAGEATLEVKSDMSNVGGRDCYHVVGTGESVGAFSWFFKVRDRYESVIDKNALVPW